MTEGNGFNDSYNGQEDIEPYIRRFEDMIKNNANYFFDVDVFEAIIDYYLERNNLKSAMKGISMATSQHPDAIPILLRKAEVYASTGKLYKSLEILNRIEHIEPHNEEIYILRAGIFSQQRNHEEAIRNLKQAIRFAREEADDLYVDLAFEYENLKKWDKAITCLKKAIELNGENEAALFELAYCYEMSGAPAEGVDFFNHFIDANPYSYTAWYNIGTLYSRAGAYEKALEAFDLCLTLNEGFSSAYFNKANTYVQLEMYHEAINCYAETFIHEEPQAVTYCYIGECFEKLDMPDEAYSNFMKATRIDDEMTEAWIGLGIASGMLEKNREAVVYVEKALLLDSKNADYWYIYGEILEKAERTEEALNAYRTAMSLDPDNLELILDYSNFLYEYYAAEEAIHELQLHIDRLPQQIDLCYRMVAYLLFDGKKAQALALFEQLLQNDYAAHEKLITYFPDLKAISAVTDLLELYRK